MSLYYITGVPGSGKTTIQSELKLRGYETYDTDDLANFYHINTGEKATSGHTAKERTQAWRRYHEWKVPVKKIDTLHAQSVGKVIFLCGVAANDAVFWHVFTEVFCLYVPAEEIKHRLIGRVGSEVFGKNPHELATALEWASYSKKQYEDLGAVIIDAMQPVRRIADDIIGHIDGH